MLFFAGLGNLSTLLTPLLTLMLKKERQAFILYNINLHNRLPGSNFSPPVQFSENAVNRHMPQLSRYGKLINVYRAAFFQSFYKLLNTKWAFGSCNKKTVLQKAAALVCDGMSVFMVSLFAAASFFCHHIKEKHLPGPAFRSYNFFINQK